MITIWFEPHAQTHDNADGVASGHRDVALTDLGSGRARGPMRARYEGEEFDIVFTSDTQRAYDTARLMFQVRGIPIFQDARLRECDYGDLEGRPNIEVAAARSSAITTPFPNGESYEQVAQRMRGFLDDLAHHDGKKVMIVGHGATLWTLRHLVNAMPLTEAVGSPFGGRPMIFKYESERVSEP